MDDDIREKRVFGEHATGTEAFVAAGVGLVRVGVADDRVGEFGLVHRCTARDVALSADGETLAVATDADVLVTADGTLRETGFGPAVAVAFSGSDAVAAGEDGRVAHRGDGEWVVAGRLDDVRALDADLVAAADGVYRLGGGLTYAGLDDAYDVAVGGGVPLAATSSGLYRLGNGWMDDLAGNVRVVSARPDRAHAATRETLYAHADGAWTACDLPVDVPVVGVGYAGDATYAVTADGAVCAEAGDGWRTRTLGVPGVTAIAVREADA